MTDQVKQQHGKPDTFHIIVNARAHEVSGHRISYRDVVNLAFPGDPGEILYSIHYVAPKLMSKMARCPRLAINKAEQS